MEEQLNENTERIIESFNSLPESEKREIRIKIDKEMRKRGQETLNSIGNFLTK